MKRFGALLLALALVLTLFSGCAGTPAGTQPPDANASQTPNTSPDPETPAGEPAFPATVTDQIGTSVTLDAPAQRIVSGYYISTSACIALGLKDRLVGVEEKTNARPIYALSAPELPGSAANVGSAKAFDLEACVAAEPDLVILPKKAKDYAATLTEMGIPTIVVNPESHQQLTEMIGLIAALVGADEAAEKLFARYDQLLEKLSAATAALTEADRPVVYMCGASSYMSTAPREMYQAALITAAGGRNAGDALEGDSRVDVSYEQFLVMNPDVIIIPTNSMANGRPDYSAEDIMADANLAEVTAVKNSAIYYMPTGLEAWDSPVPSGVLGMLWLLNTLHPDAYSGEELIADAVDFYETFYGFSMDPSIIIG